MPINPKYLAKFEPGNYYHVYNRCAPGKLMFHDSGEYYYFLGLCKKYLAGYFHFYAYALIPNHFHLFVQVDEKIQEASLTDVNALCVRQFKNMFISYSNAINKKHKAYGGTFVTPFKRIEVSGDAYFTQLIYYIHCNPVHHKLTQQLAAYPYTSYHSFLTGKPTLLEREIVLNWFYGREQFIKYHELYSEGYRNASFMIE